MGTRGAQTGAHQMPVVPHSGAKTSVCLFGAPLDTGNLGVSALGLATVSALLRRSAHVDLTIFDNGCGTRQSRIDLPGGSSWPVELRGAWHSRRWYRPESLRAMQAASFLRPTPNPNVAAIDAAGCVLDISGGDSFSDIYGTKRFDRVTLPKRIALRRGIPLVLLPQTYGPFAARRNARLARQIITSAAAAWARDPVSHSRLQDLLGSQYDPARHREAVDVAFSLPVRRPPDELAGLIEGWASETEVVGVNVSGLLFHDGVGSSSAFGLATHYRTAVERLVRRLLEKSDARVVLIPHVTGPRESDVTACEELVRALPASDRLHMLPGGLDAMQTKWVISKATWITGARMHATIAALSSMTPVGGLAYSDKMAGVFDSCGIATEAMDARAVSTDEVIDALWDSYQRRAQTAATLRKHVPDAIARCEAAFDEIVGSLQGVA